MKKNNQIIELQYFGAVKAYSNLTNESNVFFLDDLRYEKLLHPNRMFLGGSNGLVLLTIPLAGGRNKKQLMKEVELSYEQDWKKNHWRAIYTIYKKSPWFDEYAPSLENLYRSKEQFLVDWNLKTMKWALEALRLKLDILSLSYTEADLQSPKKEHQPRKDVDPLYPCYHQVFMDRQGFIANLSILDLLFCCGPYSKNYLLDLLNYYLL